MLKKLVFYRQILEKYSKFYGNLSIGSGVISCGRTDEQTDMTNVTDEQTDMTKVTDTFRSFANAPKNSHLRICILRSHQHY